MLPVPLNSSKDDFVHSASRYRPAPWAMIVNEPPSSTLRAEPKNRLGLCNALASTPPDRIFPECGANVL